MFKWIAGVTAVVSLVLSIHQVINLGGAARQKRQQVAELLAAEKVQKDSGNFAGAWRALRRRASSTARATPHRA